jgi:hypothetical protein
MSFLSEGARRRQDCREAIDRPSEEEVCGGGEGMLILVKAEQS